MTAETSKSKPPRLKKAVFEQDADSCSDSEEPQQLTVEIEDAGAGPYLILKTERWAVDSVRNLSFLNKLFLD